MPTVFIGDHGIVYPKNRTEVQKDGPFVDVTVIETEKGGISKVVIRRQEADPVQIETKIENEWKKTLSNVTDYEPISVEIYSLNKADKPASVVEFDCCYRGADKGTVCYGTNW